MLFQLFNLKGDSVTIVDSDKKISPEIDSSGQQSAAHRAALNSRIAASSSVPESGQAARVALKKLELTTNHNAVIQKQLLQLDARHDDQDYGVLLPW